MSVCLFIEEKMILVLITLTLISAVCSQIWDPNCGISKFEDAGRDQGTDSYIIGGWESRDHEFPWQVSVRARNASHYCGGVLITPTHVLTAAHCTRGTTIEEVVVAEQNKSADNPDKQVIPVATIWEHENYTTTAEFVYNDISIIEMETAAVLSENVAPICAPLNESYAYVAATVSGWGTTNKIGSATPDNLHYTNIWTLTNQDCRAGACDMLAVGPGSICAIGIEGGVCTGDNAKRDTCYGDSGGPMAVKDSDGKWHVIGLTSWGRGCASPYPGVYTRVSNYNSWICEKMGVTDCN